MPTEEKDVKGGKSATSGASQESLNGGKVTRGREGKGKGKKTTEIMNL